jgi:hypothetical protein
VSARITPLICITKLKHGAHRLFELENEHDFQVVSGVLRMATKYQVPALRQRAMEPLLKRYPTSLSAWDAMRGNLRSFSDERYREGSRNTADHIRVINLARETDSVKLLPAAFATLTLSSSRRALDPTFHNKPPDFPCIASAVDVRNFTFVKESHCDLIFDIQSLLSSHRAAATVPGCTSKPAPCPQFAQAFEALTENVAWKAHIWNSVSVLELARALLAKLQKPVCPACLASFNAGVESARRKWWDNLPKALLFSGWDELNRTAQD